MIIAIALSLTSASLREFVGGRMLMSAFDLLPIINSTFMGGDRRVLEHPALATIHTLFVREHNRIAGKASNLT
jgi:peroxidase